MLNLQDYNSTLFNVISALPLIGAPAPFLDFFRINFSDLFFTLFHNFVSHGALPQVLSQAKCENISRSLVEATEKAMGALIKTYEIFVAEFSNQNNLIMRLLRWIRYTYILMSITALPNAAGSQNIEDQIVRSDYIQEHISQYDANLNFTWYGISNHICVQDYGKEKNEWEMYNANQI